jgi:hypothetical protein
MAILIFRSPWVGAVIVNVDNNKGTLTLPIPLLSSFARATDGDGDGSQYAGSGNSNAIPCQMPNAICNMPYAKCQMPNAKCQMPNAKCQMSKNNDGLSRKPKPKDEEDDNNENESGVATDLVAMWDGLNAALNDDRGLGLRRKRQQKKWARRQRQ